MFYFCLQTIRGFNLISTLVTYLKGVKKVCSAIKLCSYYFSYNLSNGINVTDTLDKE